jgi:ATP-binding cassette, subfamily F, member 3
MTVLDVNRASKRYLSDLVLSEISFKLTRGDKVGLVGANGCGKSTLLKLIAGTEALSAGTITRPTRASIGYLAQELKHDETRTVLHEVRDAFAPLLALQQRLRELEHALSDNMPESPAQRQALDEYGRVSAEFEQRGGYTIDHRVNTVLQGLRLSERRQQLLSTLSGGEKNVVALARVLLTQPDILLLDEPANHLDFAGLDWLESFLRQCEQTIVLVSHNRYLLDRVVDSVLEIDAGGLMRFTGNYSAYRAEKTRQLLAQQVAFQAQQREVQRLESMIKRFQLWASMTDDPRQARRARNKQRVLDRMDRIDRPDLDPQRIDPLFQVRDAAGDIALQLKRYTRLQGQKLLFDQVDVHLAHGDRVGLIGANGTGKSTLFRDIVEHGAWDNQEIRIGPRVRLGYYAQEHETIDSTRTILREMQELPGVGRDRAFSVLSRFLFRWEDMERVIGTLSGGEKSRVQLARLMLSDVNFLLLDEPTNHLDLFSRERVEEALEEFTGTLLVISHDRYFLDRIVERVVEIQPPALRGYVGGFSQYWETRLTRQADDARAGGQTQEGSGPSGSASGGGDQPDARRRTMTRRSPRPDAAARAHQQRAAEIEAAIEEAEPGLAALADRVAAAYGEGRHADAQRLTLELNESEEAVARLYADWERAAAG